jgi:hypothetical protein
MECQERFHARRPQQQESTEKRCEDREHAEAENDPYISVSRHQTDLEEAVQE